MSTATTKSANALGSRLFLLQRRRLSPIAAAFTLSFSLHSFPSYFRSCCRESVLFASLLCITVRSVSRMFHILHSSLPPSFSLFFPPSSLFLPIALVQAPSVCALVSFRLAHRRMHTIGPSAFLSLCFSTLVRSGCSMAEGFARCMQSRDAAQAMTTAGCLACCQVQCVLSKASRGSGKAEKGKKREKPARPLPSR